MASITARPTQDRKHKDRDRPQKSRARVLPPPVTIARKGENLDRRIRNLESLGSDVFIGNVLASYMALPGLVGFWPMSSVQRSTGNAYDLSGQGRTLTRAGNPAYSYFNGLVPYIDLDGTGDYLSRADETDLDIVGDGESGVFTNPGAAGFTIGLWVNADSVSGTQFLASKDDDAAQRTFAFYLASGVPTSFVFNTAVSFNSASGGSVTAGTWTHLVMRFVPSTELTIFQDGQVVVSTTASIVASLFLGTAALQIGARNAVQLFDGKLTQLFLCANALGDDLISSLFQTSRVLFGV